VLPLGIGWSLWIHLFVQYPKTIGAVILVFVLSSVPIRHTGLEMSDQSVTRAVFCAVIVDAPASSSDGWRVTGPSRTHMRLPNKTPTANGDTAWLPGLHAEQCANSDVRGALVQ
jgi:hypothetical protein